MGRTWRKEERIYNKKKFKKGQQGFDRSKRTIKDDERETKRDSREQFREEFDESEIS